MELLGKKPWPASLEVLQHPSAPRFEYLTIYHFTATRVYFLG